MNDFIIRLFNIKTYETDYEKLLEAFKALRHETDILKGANDVLARKVVDLEDSITELSTEPEQYIERKVEEIVEQKKQQWISKGIVTGRQSVFSEVGIWVLDAKERDNCIVKLSNDPLESDFVELIDNKLVDVYKDETNYERVKRDDIIGLPSEISLDGLVKGA